MILRRGFDPIDELGFSYSPSRQARDVISDCEHVENETEYCWVISVYDATHTQPLIGFEET